MLAVMKVNAAYVPLDAAFPARAHALHPRRRRDQGDRLDVGVRGAACAARRATRSFSTAPSAQIDAKPDASRLTDVPRRPPIRSATSSTPRARPAIRRASPSRTRASAISCASPPSFTAMQPGDRVYQGMTIAFDFSIEEIWVPLMAGATLVPARPGLTLIGDELADFLRERDVTVMACCPTLLATIEQDLPQLRILLVGGEACPQNLVARWYRPGRTHPQFLRPDRSDRHRDPDRIDAGQAGDHRRSAADLFDRHPRSGRGQDRRARRTRRDRHRRRRPRARLHESRRTDDEEVHPRFPQHPEQPVRAASIAPATSAASTRTARSNTAAASTPRSRSAAIASSSTRSKRCCSTCRRSRRPP